MRIWGGPGAIYNQVGKRKVDVLVNPRDVRCVWVVNPVRVGLGSGWAQAMTRVHGDKPIHASAWKADLKLLRSRYQKRISPSLYQREKSKMLRDELVRTAAKTTRRVRREKEKVKETRRKIQHAQDQSHNGATKRECGVPQAETE